MHRLFKIIPVIALLAMAGCDLDNRSPAQRVMDERIPSDVSRIFTDEAGNRYVVTRNKTSYGSYLITPYVPLAPKTP